MNICFLRDDETAYLNVSGTLAETLRVDRYRGLDLQAPDRVWVGRGWGESRVPDSCEYRAGNTVAGLYAIAVLAGGLDRLAAIFGAQRSSTTLWLRGPRKLREAREAESAANEAESEAWDRVETIRHAAFTAAYPAQVAWEEAEAARLGTTRHLTHRTLDEEAARAFNAGAEAAFAAAVPPELQCEQQDAHAAWMAAHEAKALAKDQEAQRRKQAERLYRMIVAIGVRRYAVERREHVPA